MIAIEGGWSVATARAQTVQFQFMGLNRKAVTVGDFFLQSFDIFVGKFHDFSTGRANEMVVVPFV
jgi:hypothetical protein